MVSIFLNNEEDRAINRRIAAGVTDTIRAETGIAKAEWTLLDGLFEIFYCLGEIIHIVAILREEKIDKAPGLAFADAGKSCKELCEFVEMFHKNYKLKSLS